MNLALEALKWYGIAWGVSLTILLIPGWLSGNRFMFGPIRDMLLLDDSDLSPSWKNTIIVAGLILLPLFALKHVLSPFNWGIPQLETRLFSLHVWVFCRKALAIALKHSPFIRMKGVERFSYRVAKEQLALNLVRHKENYPRIWEFGKYLEGLYNLRPSWTGNEDITISFDPDEAAAKITGAFEELKTHGVSEVLASEMLDILVDPPDPRKKRSKPDLNTKVATPPTPYQESVRVHPFGGKQSSRVVMPAPIFSATFLGVELVMAVYLQTALRRMMTNAVKAVKTEVLTNPT